MAKRRKRTNANLPAKGRMRDIADALWSLAVRDDWANICAICGKRATEAHHIVPRQFYAVRYELRNGIALCSRCHQFDANLSPHQNALGFAQWLDEHHPAIFEWYEDNYRPDFHGTLNAEFYCGVIRDLRQYVSEEDYTRIVGKRFSAWLEGEK